MAIGLWIAVALALLIVGVFGPPPFGLVSSTMCADPSSGQGYCETNQGFGLGIIAGVAVAGIGIVRLRRGRRSQLS